MNALADSSFSIADLHRESQLASVDAGQSGLANQFSSRQTCLQMRNLQPRTHRVVTMIFGKSPVVIATIMAVLLNLILPKDGKH